MTRLDRCRRLSSVLLLSVLAACAFLACDAPDPPAAESSSAPASADPAAASEATSGEAEPTSDEPASPPEAAGERVAAAPSAATAGPDAVPNPLDPAPIPTDAGPADAGDGPFSLSLVASPQWFDFARQLADTRYLARAWTRAGIEVPEGSFIYAARVLDGVGQPALAQYSWGETGFVAASEDPWPASTVKLMAAVAALLSLREFGLDGTTTLRFTDPYGEFEGTVRDLIDGALVPSDNPPYNRLMLISGLDAFHGKHFRRDDAFPVLVQQRFYVKPDPTANFVVSPEIAWETPDGRTGVIPERTATGDYSACADEGNCVTLFELTEVLRRVAFHDALPKHHRFRLTDDDHAYLMQALVDTKCKYDEAVAEVLGLSVDELVDINKAGKVRGDDHLDHVLFVEPNGRRWFLAISVPYLERDEPDEVSQAKLDMLAKATMQALLDQPETEWPTPLQWPAAAGDLADDWVPGLTIEPRERDGRVRLSWTDPRPDARLVVYRNQARVGAIDEDEPLELELVGGDLIVAQLEARRDATPLAYRVFRVADARGDEQRN